MSGGNAIAVTSGQQKFKIGQEGVIALNAIIDVEEK